jgi:hypothetical protein
MANAQPDNGLLEGKVTYITQNNVYVKFDSTSGLKSGDTLYSENDNKRLPLLIVKDLSSTSALCSPLSKDIKIQVADKLIARDHRKDPITISTPEKGKSDTPGGASQEKGVENTATGDSKPKVARLKQAIHGRIAMSTFSTFANTPTEDLHRMRYTCSLNAEHIGGTALGAESYITFTHRNKEWDTITKNPFYGLKVFDLSANYKFGEHSTIWLGRKINNRISNVGAIDGLQFEHKFGKFFTGIITGFRPDLADYSFNSNLMQYGGYVAHEFNTKTGNYQSTFAIIEQQNASKTDRRYAYFQHSNMINKYLGFFGSAEFDLYKKTPEKTDNTPVLSNLYLSLRYKILKNLSASASYSERNNIIYYQSFPKNVIEQYLEAENQKGYTFQLNYQPWRKVSIGGNAGYRTQKNDPNPSRNFYAFASYSKIPRLDIAATVSATVLESSYLNGKIYSAGISREFFKERLSADLFYRYIDYQYTSMDGGIKQNVAELGLSYRITRKLNASVNYESTFQGNYRMNQVYASISQRF